MSTTRWTRQGSLVGLLLVVVGLAFAGSAATVGSADPVPLAVARTALVNTGSGASGAQETEVLSAQGYVVTSVNDANWATMTASQFGAYDLLVVPDPVGLTPPGVAASASAWGAAVLGTGGGRSIEGNRIVVATDVSGHSGGSTTARATIMREGIAFAGAIPGATGMYFDGYYDQGGGTGTIAAVDAMSTGAGAWTVNQSPPCGGSVSLIAEHPAFSTLTTASLQGWNCSVHASFPTFRSDWSALAVATDTPSHPTCGIDPDTGLNACGEAYILVAGSSIVVGSEKISVSPLEATNPPGTSHTVTANVHQVGGSPVIAGQHVDFLVTGVNSGATGSCVPVDCTSDSAGNVAFTYTGGSNEGDDTIKASFSDSVGSLQAATAQKHWVTGTTTHHLAVTTSGSGSVTSSPAGIACPTTCGADFDDATVVGLTATPASGSTFSGWSGACTGTGSCSVTMSADRSVTATFVGSSAGHLLITSSVAPRTVSPGSMYKTHFSVKNDGDGSIGVALVGITLPAGVMPVSITPSKGLCSAFSNGSAACLFGDIPAGGSRGIDVLAIAPSGDGPLLASIGVMTDDGQHANATAGPTVRALRPGSARGFVPPGGSISTGTSPTASNNTVATFTLPNTGPGAQITLRSETDETGAFCGGLPCPGKILYLSPFSGYTNTRYPAKLKIVYDKTVAGRGVDSTIYVQKEIGGPVVPVADCLDTSIHLADPHPCVHERTRRDSGDIEFEILLISGDPRFAHR